MNNFWLKIKVWTKLVLFVLIAVYVLVFVAKNSERPVTPWLFVNREPQTSVLILSLFCFLLGVVGTLLIRTTLVTIRQIRDLRAKGKTIKMERELSEMKAKASRLQTRSDKPAEPARAFPVEPVPSPEPPDAGDPA